MLTISRGTTPAICVGVPVSPENIKLLRIIFSQNDGVILVKEKHDCTIEDGVASFKMTQEETFAFHGDMHAKAQVRILTTEDDAPGSYIFDLYVYDCLEEEVMKRAALRSFLSENRTKKSDFIRSFPCLRRRSTQILDP